MALPHIQYKITVTDILGGTAVIGPTMMGSPETVNFDELAGATGLTYPIVGVKCEVNTITGAGTATVKWGFLKA